MTLPRWPSGDLYDTVTDAGKYDGALGVLLALATVEALGGKRLPFALEIIGFSEEEGVRYRTPYLGSRAVVGAFEPELLALRDQDGVSLRDCLERFGCDTAAIGGAAYTPGQLIGYVEAHIEQGPVLEARDLPVGVVSAIAGQSRLRLRFGGQAAHAGTTPMGALRRDALAGAAAFIGAVEAEGLATLGLVATVGAVTVSPNAGNVIPGVAEIGLDVRHASDALRAGTVDCLLQQAERIAEARGLTWNVVERSDFGAVPMDAALRAGLGAAIARENFPVCEMVSGAGHDAAVLAAHIPAAMLFLRSPNGGVSHHPDESVYLQDMETALRVLLRFVMQYELPAPFARQKDKS